MEAGFSNISGDLSSLAYATGRETIYYTLP